ncbi:PIN domain-containing protein [Intestinibacillus massiliensis]|uniref:PIN domain-containing protein n=1 Tax=Intestinibacillus massiliensis TaxID=1871029 RepID=UPI000B357E03|nr:PIN domain-containing protein [Intestinibacillus massiliensis]
MKDSIWEYIDLSKEDKETLWDNGIFVFDANVLLNLYRYSSRTSSILIGALEKLSERIWLPHQVAYEFMKNRCAVIFDVCNKYDAFEKEAADFLAKAKSLSNLQDSDVEIQQLKRALDEWIAQSRSQNIQVKNPGDDLILLKVLDLFNGRTGNRYDDKKLSEIKEMAVQRFAAKMPPGYEDSDKRKSDSDDNNAYGDFIVWMQIIDFAIENHKDIIYVTHDQKEDWWYKVKGRIVGPRVELRKEFFEKTAQHFHMYSMNNFIELYSHKYQDVNNERVIEEVKRVETEANRKRKPIYSESEKLSRRISKLEIKIQRSQRTIDSLLHKYADSKFMPTDVQIQLDNTRRNMDVKKDMLDKMKLDYAALGSEE